MESRRSESECRSNPRAHSRRTFMKQASLLALGAQTGSVLSGRSAQAEDSGEGFVVAETSDGKVRGRTVDGVNVFKGIPYGGTTAGRNRFMPPTKPAPWEGLRDALEWGHIAPQTIIASGSDYGTLIRWMDQPGGQSEDCLVLNVWTPAIGDGGRRPVLVSFHGGGFTSGSGNHEGFDGQYLARLHDSVVVTVNHRLGVLGYLHLGDLSASPDFAQSGVAGMLDCVAALEWVRDNIEDFGGDPGSVMIFGQSGGGAKTTALLAMPTAKGLFHRAAIQSGSSLRLKTRESGTKEAERLLERLGLDKTQLRELQDVPFEKMVAAQAALGRLPPAGFAPIVDGTVFPRHPFDPDAPEFSADVPIIVSTTLDDAAIGLTNFELDDAGLKKIVDRIAGDSADRVLAAYRKAYPEAPPYLLQARMFTDRRFRRGAITMAERKAAQNAAPVYMYLFTHESPGFGGKFGAVHGTDVALVFHNPAGDINEDTEVARRLAKQMASAWVAFAKTGNPNTPELPEWPPYDFETRATMIFDADSHVENDPDGELRRLWEEIDA